MERHNIERAIRAVEELQWYESQIGLYKAIAKKPECISLSVRESAFNTDKEFAFPMELMGKPLDTPSKELIQEILNNEVERMEERMLKLTDEIKSL